MSKLIILSFLLIITTFWARGASRKEFDVLKVCGYPLNQIISLIDQEGIDVNYVDKNGDNLLECFITLIIPRYAEKNRRSRLIQEITEKIKALVLKGMDIHHVNKKKQNALHVAALEGTKEFLKVFLDAGVDVNAKDKAGNTPLHSVRKDFSTTEKFSVFEKAAVLVEHGADPTIKNKLGKLPRDQLESKATMELFSLEDTRVQKILKEIFLEKYEILREKAKKAPQKDWDVLDVCHKTQKEIISILEEGFKVNKVHYNGITLLDCLIGRQFEFLLSPQKETVEDIALTVKEIVKRGIDIKHVDQEKQTVLHHAARMGTVEVLKILVDTGIDVNARDKLGNTPLHSIGAFGLKGKGKDTIFEKVAVLVEHGADPTIKNYFGMLPREGLKSELPPEVFSSRDVTVQRILKKVFKEKFEEMQNRTKSSSGKANHEEL